MTRRLGRLAGAALVAMVSACQAAAPPSPPAGDLSLGERSVRRRPAGVVDVLTYKVDNARTGVMPGPALVNSPRSSGRSNRCRQRGVPAGLRRRGDHRVARWPPQRARRRLRQRKLVAPLDAGIASTPTIADRFLYVVTEDGVLRAVRLADRSISWTAAGFLDETIVTVIGDLVLAGGPGELVALSVNDGQEQWRKKVGDPIGSPPTAPSPMSPARARARSRRWQWNGAELWQRISTRPRPDADDRRRTASLRLDAITPAATTWSSGSPQTAPDDGGGSRWTAGASARSPLQGTGSSS